MSLTTNFVKILDTVRIIKLKEGSTFPARAYEKARDKLMTTRTSINSLEDLDIDLIGKSAYNILKEYYTTGTVEMIEHSKNNPLYTLTDVFGIGPKKANDLVNNHNIKSVDDLRSHTDLLTRNQIIGLKHYDDILKRIPRQEIMTYEKQLEYAFGLLKSKTAKYEIVGSYRRGAKDSGDIDIIITDDSKDSDIFSRFLDILIERKILTEVLSRGKVKCLGISQPRRKPSRRIDFMFTPREEYAFAVLYFTGSKAFNTVMRARALKMGYSMNEHGLYKMANGKKGERLNNYFPTEESIFKFLGMVYKTPEQRKDYRSAEYIDSNYSSNTVAEVVKLPSSHKTLKKNRRIIKNRTLKKKGTMEKLSLSKQTTIHDMVKEYLKKGSSYLNKLDEEHLSYFIRALNKYYYCNNKPLVDDEQYDILKEYIEEFYPSNVAVKEGHTKCNVAQEKSKVKLPYTLWSMDKIKEARGVMNKLKKYKHDKIISVKVDGISAMYYKGKLYTRGNGTYGQDISWLLKYIHMPPNIGSDVVRGELLIKKETFDNKYKGLFCNMRNLVAGIANAKNIIIEQANDIDFVAYEVIEPANLKPLEQLEYLSSKKYNHVEYLHKKNKDVNKEMLSKLLVHWRENYLYDNDGIIITDNCVYQRVNGNPEHAFAFKMVLSDQIVETMVIEVRWTPSKDGYLKPKLKVQPVVIGGATIQYVTAHNAAFVRDKSIGIGTKIQIIRSGDVIPKVHKVVKASSAPLMPSPEDYDFKWNASNIDIILNDIDSNEIVKMKRISEFFKNLEVDGLGRGNVQRMMNAGYDSVYKILNMTKDDFMEVDGFQEKKTKKVYNSIHSKVRQMPLINLMTATNIFGRGMGYSRLKLILDSYPDILTSEKSEEELYEDILKLPGFKIKTAQNFVPYIGEFLKFLKDCKLMYKLKDYKKKVEEAKAKQESGPLKGRQIVITGFRDKEFTDLIDSLGGVLANNVNKNTSYIIVKDLETQSTKIAKGKKLGIKIMKIDDFKNAVIST
jgi:DNA ligase (NAD+)